MKKYLLLGLVFYCSFAFANLRPDSVQGEYLIEANMGVTLVEEEYYQGPLVTYFFFPH